MKIGENMKIFPSGLTMSYLYYLHYDMERKWEYCLYCKMSEPPGYTWFFLPYLQHINIAVWAVTLHFMAQLLDLWLPAKSTKDVSMQYIQYTLSDWSSCLRPICHTFVHCRTNKFQTGILSYCHQISNSLCCCWKGHRALDIHNRVGKGNAKCGQGNEGVQRY